MLTLFRWLLRLTVASLILAVAAVVLVWYFAIRSLPDYTETLHLSGLEQPVEIVRTTEGVPHILAKTDRDAFFALGLVHAQDRLFQMTVLRRAAQGRLSEIYGARAYPADDLARRLGLWRSAQASLAAQNDATKAALKAYADGVNSWIGEINAGARGRGAPEFFLYPDEIAYWQPADSLAVLKLLAAASSRQISDEVLRARLSIASPTRGQEVVARPLETPLPPYAALFPGAAMPALEKSAALPDTPFDALAGFLKPGIGMAGDSVAVEGERAAGGAPLLANDVQNPLTAPSIWYPARLDLMTGGVIGATIPGIPAVLAGRSAKLAWGITPAQVDDADLVMEEVQPGAPDNYRAATGWVPFQTRHEIIRIRDGKDRPITLRDTANGPVLSGAQLGLGAITPSGHVAALRWTGLAGDDRTMSALIALMSAQDRSAAILAAQDVVAPALDLTLADRQGVLGWIAGALPVRRPDHPTAGRMPVPGWSDSGRWQGLVDPADPARTATPQWGMVATTGGTRITPPPAPDGIKIKTPTPEPLPTDTTSATDKASDIAVTAQGPAMQPAAPVAIQPPPALPLGYDRDEPLRQARLDRIMAARQIHSRESLIDTQLDTISPAARQLLPLVGAELWYTGEPAAEGTPERQRQDALSLLAQWDGEMGEHLPEPAIYAVWMAELQQRLIRDELGPLAEDITTLQPSFIERVFRNTNGASAWCDVVQSAPIESCSIIARQALDAAILRLSARFGPNVNNWRWGDLHEARHEHPGLGNIPGLRWIVSLIQPTSGGDFTLSRAATLGSGPNPWQNGFAAGYRGVYDLSDPDSSVFIVSTGVSGHPLSRHYDDLAALWRRGEYIAMSLDPTLARAGAEGITRLEPAP